VDDAEELMPGLSLDIPDFVFGVFHHSMGYLRLF